MIAMIALIRNDVILFLQDKRALMLTLLMPIFLAGFFGYIFGGSGTKEMSKIEIALTNDDTHVISQKIAAGLKQDAQIHVVELALVEAKAAVLKGKISMALHIPQGFGEAAGAAMFGRADKPELPLYFDPSQQSHVAIIKGLLTQQVMQHVSAQMMHGQSGIQSVEKALNELAGKTSLTPQELQLQRFLKSLKEYQGSAPASADENTGAGAGFAMPFSTREEAVAAKSSFESQYNGYAHSFAGMIVQFILFMGIDVGVGVLLARRLGLWNRLLAAPLSTHTLIIARTLSCSLISFFVVCFIFAVAIAFFQVRILGSWPGFIGIAMSFSLMTASFGLLVAAFGKTAEAARRIASFATLILVMLGGAWMPSFLFPQWLQAFTLWIPTRWAVDGFDAMTWRGLGFSQALPAIAVLTAFALLFGALALWGFRREQGAR
ncbi:MAG: ABC transporter permease [Burkholderiales bacterium]|nr:ABC transporter permease [Burkholderiales bacterium]